MLVSGLVLLGSLVASTTALYGSGDAVVDLTPSNFDKQVGKSALIKLFLYIYTVLRVFDDTMRVLFYVNYLWTVPILHNSTNISYRYVFETVNTVNARSSQNSSRLYLYLDSLRFLGLDPVSFFALPLSGREHESSNCFSNLAP
jgi:hypothetical protein